MPHTNAIADYSEAIKIEPAKTSHYVQRGEAYEESADLKNSLMIIAQRLISVRRAATAILKGKPNGQCAPSVVRHQIN